MNVGFNANQHVTGKRRIWRGRISKVPVVNGDVRRDDIGESVVAGSVDELHTMQTTQCVRDLTQERIRKPGPFRDRCKRVLRGLSKDAALEFDDPSPGIVVRDRGQLRPLRNDCDTWSIYQDGVIHSDSVTAPSLHITDTCRHNESKS